ncbi:MAG: PfkB family carbohydrate kinase [Sphaerochaetaceae bacterium]
MIAILGEALIDFVGSKGSDGKDLFYYYNGGSALNTAVATARLNASTLYLGKLSKDMFGKQMQVFLEANNVKLVPWLCDVEQNSMIGFAKLDTGGSASYVFYTQGTTVTELSKGEILRVFEQYTAIDYLLVGSVAVALEKSGNAILEALQTVGKTRFNLIFDPNVRPTVIDDFARYQQRVFEFVKLSYLVKLSDEDLLHLFPAKSLADGVASLLKLGAEQVVLTKGKEGLEWHNSQGLNVKVPAVDNPIVDTIGAGDTVSGALLNFLQENNLKRSGFITEEQAREALSFAAKAAAVTTGREGADPPKRFEVV